LSGYIGWRIGGFIGLLVSIFATVLPTAILMTLLLTTLNAFKDHPWVQGMSKGVIPIAGVMIGILAWDFIKLSNKYLGLFMTIFFTVLSLILMEFFEIHPAFIIVSLFIYAFMEKEKDNRSEKDRVVDDL